MSFILDALKKSEAERKRQDTPGIASIPAATESSSGSRWIWIIAALLTINVVVLTGVVLKPSGEAPSESATATQSPAMEPAPGLDTRPASEPEAEPPQAVASSIAQTPMTDAAPAVTEQAPVVNARPAPAEPSDLPTLDELRTAGRLQLPDLHVDIHVYSAQPADRFVFVNMTKYRENSKLAEGPVVTRITPDGVEMDYLGTAFLLPRE
jgi:general secretion pathway protein B